MRSKLKNGKTILLIILVLATFLRLWRINEVPVSLFGDELDVGYHAYSVLKTGRDYSGNFMPLHLQSMAEWRTPLYLYSCVPTVALFGISPLGVRLPAAIFGILGVYAAYLLVKALLKNEKLALVSAFVLAISPWHIQYSRAAFEVTQLLAFLLFGLYFFFLSQKEGRYLWVSVVFMVMTPWIYSSAKLFTPVLMLLLFLLWKRDIMSLPRKDLVRAVIAGLVVGLPVAYSTLFAGGAQRFGYISIFSDPTRETEIGYQRELDAKARGELHAGLQPSISDKLFHNKFAFWGSGIADNYFRSISFDFLFRNGDPNPRHAIEGMGQFYMVEVAVLILGLVLFFSSKTDRRIKLFVGLWLLWSVVPASITREGGDHATRLILMLPPLVFLISYGLVETYKMTKGNIRFLLTTFYILLLFINFIFYQHNYWVHNPTYSERWWHAGFEESMETIKEIQGDYEKVIISMAGEPAWIFFAGWYEYDPKLWHQEFPIGNDEYLEGFGEVSHTGKFYFGSPQKELGGFYSLSDYIDEKTLYLAVAKEVGTNLIMESERVPNGLQLIKPIAYPSGEPAFYLFSGIESNEFDSI